MRILLSLMVLLAAGLASAEVWRLDPAGALTVTCSAGGGSAVAVPGGYFELHVSGETSYVCYAEACVLGGMERVPGNHGVYLIGEGQVSCRASTAGVVQLVPAVFVR